MFEVFWLVGVVFFEYLRSTVSCLQSESVRAIRSIQKYPDHNDSSLGLQVFLYVVCGIMWLVFVPIFDSFSIQASLYFFAIQYDVTDRPLSRP